MVKENKDTEGKILEAARKVFTRKGMGGARMQEIADEAGINKAMLHYYFRSKERLYEAIFQEVLRNFFPSLIGILNKTSEFKDKVADIVELYTEEFKDNTYIPIFLINEIHQNPARLDAIGSKVGLIHDTAFFKEYMEKVQSGEFLPLSPMHLMVNILALTIFPILANPILFKIFETNPDGKKQFWEERKILVPQLIMETIINKQK
ncbi:MAG: TetR/AcrR family transcriptional regulator [Cyclobacteriaceae bacterium]|nr:TetR/AcrR family transcriptional regulator [Cyclobacteriaceae bacterium]